MKRETISQALGDIDRRYIAEAEAYAPQKQRKLRPGLRSAVALAAAFMVMFSVTGLALGWFSSFSGDTLTLESCYLGNGIVQVEAHNRSQKDLKLEETARLVYYSDRSAVPGLGGAAVFSTTEVPAGGTVLIEIDLSAAYDVARLEEVLPNDFYTLQLTNDGFLSGQKWSCIVSFTATGQEHDTWQDVDRESLGMSQEQVLPELKGYFETFTADIFARWTDAFQYMETVEAVLADKKVAAPQDPWLIADLSDVLAGSLSTCFDGYNKLIGRSGEEKYSVIHVDVPTAREGEMTGSYGLPLFYLFAYQTADTRAEDAMAFVRGNLLTFEEMEAYKVYEDETYTVYEMHEFFYDDLGAYVADMCIVRDDIYLDEAVMERIETVYGYLKDQETLGALLYYQDSGSFGQRNKDLTADALAALLEEGPVTLEKLAGYFRIKRVGMEPCFVFPMGEAYELQARMDTAGNMTGFYLVRTATREEVSLQAGDAYAFLTEG